VSRIQLLQHQDEIAAKIFHGLTVSIDSVAQIPAPGIEKTDIMLAAITRGGARNKTILIACARAMMNQWGHHIHAMFPSAPVLYYGVSEVGNTKYRTFTQIMPKITMSYTFDFLANHDWKLEPHRSPGCFFLVTFSYVKHVAERFEKWFDVAVQDEYFPSVKMDHIHDRLRQVAKTVVRVGFDHQ
jgi:hypothetical protein